MNGILSLIFMLSMNSLVNDVTFNIANYFIDHLSELESKNIRDISKDSYTSTTSIMKFCQLFGFSSYNDFKSMFIFTLKDRMRQLHRKLKEESIENLMNKIISISDNKIDEEIFLKSIENFVDAIHESKCIYFYGAVFPLNLCMSFGEDMTIMGIPVHFVQTSYEFKDISKKEGIHVIITYTGRYIEQRKIQYIKILEAADKIALISREQEYSDNIDIIVPLPKTQSIDYDDVVLLFILDMIKFSYYRKYFK